MKIPSHIAIIMDGNGRWAQARGLPRTMGHKKGSETVRLILSHAQKRGVRIVTLFAFSSENWGRPKEEVDTLISLFRQYLKEDVEELKKRRVRIRFIGDRYRFPKDLVERMNELEAQTAENEDFQVVLALSYGSRDDIVRAVQHIVQDVQENKLTADQLSCSVFSDYLSTKDIPDPDLVIRTSGENRISNFLLWEIAYAEFYFTKVYWPDFNEEEFDKALQSYGQRERRFGKLL